MIIDVDKYGSFVLSGVTVDYGNKIVSIYDLAVFLSAPVELRMERIRMRAVNKYGKRALPCGDMYENTENFVNFARTRDLSVIDQWANTLTCPIIHLDATKQIAENVKEIINTYCLL